MSEIPTAEEWLKFYEENAYPGTPQSECMITFAELHVTAALKEALESIPCLGSSSDIATYEEVANEVLNSYPLDKIK